MTASYRHDRSTLDILEALGGTSFEATVWRVTRSERDALRGSSANGRWSSNSEPEVLYTSLEKHGALAEIGFRLAAEPIWPSRIRHSIHAIRAKATNIVDIGKMEMLQKLGVDVPAYGSFDYTVTQAIAAAANFLEFGGLIAPSARANCNNAVFFIERNNELEVASSEEIDWDSWRKDRSRQR